ncbi:MAG: hypothetical protein IKV28_05240 [Bacteroidales bacterium]|nr:hypothetical protein [Bacteroidales bacterium]
MQRFLLILLGILCPIILQAQSLIGELDFAFRFDNREYANTRLAPSDTYFGITAAPRLGWSWQQGHSLMIGADLLKRFGKPEPAIESAWLLYYQFENEDFQTQAGIFPRNKQTGDYPNAFFDELQFFDTAIEGLRLNWNYHPNGKIEFITDWTGCKWEATRESFRIYAYGRQTFGNFYIAFPFLMHHYANSDYVRGVVDNIWIYPHAGWFFEEYNLDLRFGWLKTFQNDRRQGKGYLNPGGIQIEVTYQWHSLGVHNTLYLGKNLLPYYETTDEAGIAYADHLYLGNPFYRTEKGVYDQLELFWAPKISKSVQLKIRSIHHFTREKGGWQQLVSLFIPLHGSVTPAAFQR